MKNILVVLFPILLVACGPANDPNVQDIGNEPLEPPAPGQGIQLRMSKTIAAGEESYGCQLFQVFDEDTFMHEQTVYFGPGGHHVLLYMTPYKTIPTVDESGESVDGSKEHDCSKEITARWKVNSVLGGSEIQTHPGMFRGLPEGVALHLPAKSIVVMLVHYLNASAAPVEVDARVNINTIPPADVKTEAGLLYVDNHFLHVPPIGASTARMRCPVSSDVFIANLQSHMHGRGLLFSASALDPQAQTSNIMYETKKWLEPPVQGYEPYLALHAGQSIETRCDYENTETRTIGYGLLSTDEMCQLIGPYFPRDERLEACANAGGEYAAEWVGQGLSDGITTRACLEGAAVGSHEYVACIYDACPEIADRVSTVARCELKKGAGACLDELDALSKATCGT